MITAIGAMLNLYKQIDAVKNIPVFLDQAPAGQVEPYCIYSQIPEGPGGLQGAYGAPEMLEGNTWQFAFYEIGRNDQQQVKAAILLEAFQQGLKVVSSLALNDPNVINLSFRRVSELMVKCTGTDASTSKQRFQALTKYELLNQNQ